MKNILISHNVHHSVGPASWHTMTAKNKSASQRRRPERGQKEESRPKSGTGLSTGLIVLLGVCCLFSVSINFLHGDTFVHHHPDMAIARAMKEFKSNSFKKRRQRKQIKKVEEEPEEEEEEEDAEEEEDGRKVDVREEGGEEEGGEEEGREEEGGGEESGEGAGGEEDGGEEEAGEGEGGAEAAGGEAEEVDLEAPNTLPPSKLGGLKCDAFGGPAEEHAQDMVYWSDIPSDAKYVSPLRAKRGQRRKYMTFEPGACKLDVQILSLD